MSRILLAGFSGLMLYASFAPTGLWWAAPLGMAVFVGAVTRRNAIFASWLQGIVLYLLLLPWVGEFVGWYAWVGLAVIQSLYSLVFGIGLRWIHRSPAQGNSRRAVIFSGLGISAWYVLIEFIRSSWPFGGFPWARLAWGQVEGPLAWWIRIGGPALVTFMVVLSGVGLAWLYWTFVEGRLPFSRRHTPRTHHFSLVVPAALAVILSLGGSLGLLLAQKQADSTRADNPPPTLQVAAIQGNVPRLGLDFAAQRMAVLENHARETHKLAQAVAAGEQAQPDIVIWPENASDVNPFMHAEAAEVLDEAVAEIKAPILVGTVTPTSNRMVLWTSEGPADFHDKRFLQPFGEYMPLRDLLRKITPLVDRAGNFHPGTDNGVVPFTPNSGSFANVEIPMGVATCYEISFDGALRESVRGGAQILTTPTNNATFGFTDMTYQQLAMSRMRAIEYDRSLIVAATSGVSAIVQPNGSVTEQTRIFEADALTADLELRDTTSISARVGPWVEVALVALGAISLVLAIWLRPARVASKTKGNKKKAGNKTRNTRVQRSTRSRK